MAMPEPVVDAPYLTTLTPTERAAVANLPEDTVTALAGKVSANAAITAGTIPISYDTKGLVTGGHANLAWDASNLTLKVGAPAASANASLAILASKTVAVPASGTVWRGIDVQASTLTLTAGGTNPNELAFARFGIPTITQTAGTGYTIPIAATVVIDGPPAAGAGGGATPTITEQFALMIKTGALGAATGAAASPSIAFAADRDTGLYSAGANTLGVAVGGANAGTWNANGLVLVTTSGGATPVFSSNEFRIAAIAGNGLSFGSINVAPYTMYLQTINSAYPLALQPLGGNVVIGDTAVGATAQKTLALSNSATAPTASADLCHLYAADHNAVAGTAALALYQEAATVTCGDQTVDRAVLMTVNGVPLWVLARSAAPV